jgi:glycosyltransferase involved in cell wall biosynthesis
MKVALLSPSLSKRGGGVAEVVIRLAQNLSNLPDIKVEAFGLDDDEIKNDLETWQRIPIHICKVSGPAAFGYSSDLIPTLKNSGANLIHLHGLWQYPSLACIKTKIPYVTTIHGMLDQWAIKNSGFKKKLAAVFYEKPALKKANCLQAFTMQEYDDIRQYGLKNPVCIIPNGVDLPEDIDSIKKLDPPWKNIVLPAQKVLLYLGRIHRKKGLTNLIKAWKQSRSNGPDKYEDWNLVIAGWDQGGYENELKTLVNSLQITSSVHFIGPQFKEHKKLTFAFADGFILPSFSEGLPMAVLEAWAYELPVLMTKQCNLSEGFKSGSAIEIAATPDSIAEGLTKFFSLSNEERRAIGFRGKELVANTFNWNHIAMQMHSVYKWVLNEGPMPENILMY